VRTFSSKKDPKFSSWAGGPSAEPILSKKKGLNRFVWDMRHKGMTGVKDTYIEANFRGHKAIPGDYTVVIRHADQTASTEASIKANPMYHTSAADYKEYDAYMTRAESEVIVMHDMINSMADMRIAMKGILEELTDDTEHEQIKKDGNQLIEKMKAWDNDMIQRKSKAYDDVENFRNKFTAEYLFMINATESDLPKVNQPSKDRYDELKTQWIELRKRGEEIINTDVPQINQKLWEAGVGAIRQKQKKKVGRP